MGVNIGGSFSAAILPSPDIERGGGAIVNSLPKRKGGSASRLPLRDLQVGGRGVTKFWPGKRPLTKSG